MGIPVLGYGMSGAGKTSSLENFKEDEILYVNIENKPLPFRKKFKFKTDSEGLVKLPAMVKESKVKTVVVDDAGYLMTHIFMQKHRNMKGSQSFEMYNEIADTMYSLFNNIKNNLPEDVIVYILMHEDTNDYGSTKLKTLGKLLDDKVCLEGMVTVCLRYMSKDGKHFIRTVTNGSDITKAPRGMFEEEEIPNDLKLVDTKIREYWDIK